MNILKKTLVFEAIKSLVQLGKYEEAQLKLAKLNKEERESVYNEIVKDINRMNNKIKNNNKDEQREKK